MDVLHNVISEVYKGSTLKTEIKCADDILNTQSRFLFKDNQMNSHKLDTTRFERCPTKLC